MSSRCCCLPMESNKVEDSGRIVKENDKMRSSNSLYEVQSKVKNKIQIVPAVDLSQQSVENPKGGGGRVNSLVKDGNLQEYMYDDVRTLQEAFQRGVRVTQSQDCLGYRKEASDGSRPYHWISYEETLNRSLNIAGGMIAKGVKPGQKTFIGIYSLNRPEWIMGALACYHYSMVPVPLYDTLGPESCNQIISMTEAELIFCDTNAKALRLVHEKEKCPSLGLVVVFEDSVSPELQEASEGSNISVLTLKDLEALSGPERIPVQPPTPDDLAIICFTSGTTGPPKGAMITHRNMVAELSLSTQLKNYSITADETLLSFLPLAHMFEQLVEWMCLMTGARIGYFSGDIKMLTEDLMELQPTLLPVVPRLLNRIYDKSMQMANKNFLTRFIMRMAIGFKRRDLRKLIIRSDSIWDKLIFDKIRAKTGGRIRIMLTGSAPISEEVLTFIRCAMGCLVLEGYGQTENSAGATLTMEGDDKAGHVGPPAVHAEIKLVDVPEMGYAAEKGQGEILIRGPTIFKGYYKDEEKTREALDSEGWLWTGDVGQWTPSGCLQIIDRKKNIFKLAQGEYVAPEKIENVYGRSPYVAQIFVDGRSLEAFLVGVVAPDPEVLPEAAEKELGIKGISMEELCGDDGVKKLIMDDLKRLATEGHLNSFEQVKEICLIPEQFTVENGLLTPTLKSIRPKLKKRFEEELDAMYSSQT